MYLFQWIIKRLRLSVYKNFCRLIIVLRNRLHPEHLNVGCVGLDLTYFEICAQTYQRHNYRVKAQKHYDVAMTAFGATRAIILIYTKTSCLVILIVAAA